MQVDELGAGRSESTTDSPRSCGAAGLFSGPLGLLMTARVVDLAPGSVPVVTVTSNTTVSELLAGTVMPDTVTMPLLLRRRAAAVNELVAPGGNRHEAGEGRVVGNVVGHRHVDAPGRPRTRSA